MYWGRVVNRGWTVDWRWLVDDWGSVVDWGWLVHDWGSVPFILDIGDISVIAIGVVVDNLGAAVGKSNSVLASHLVAVRVLLLGKVGAGVLVLDAILKGIGLWGFIVGSRLVVRGSWGMI